jgi:Kef-type K+ transport system membrane component KefB
VIDYTDLAIVLAAATAGPLLVGLLPLPPVPPIVTEIVAGILIGPQVLGWAEITPSVEVFAQVGLVFLFFLAGLEIAFDAEGDRNVGRVLIAFAVSLVLAFAAAFALNGADLVTSPLLVAIVLAATSFGIVVAVLKDAGETGTPFGQLVIAGASIADFATVILLSLFFSHQGSGAESTIILLVLFAAVVAALGVGLSRARGSARLSAAVRRMHETSAQITVRIAFLLVASLVLMAEEFGLEVVLGAFLAGALLSMLDRGKDIVRSGLQAKLEGIGFGIFIPIFFVSSGVELNLSALFDSVDATLLVPATVIALLVVRGLPALLYRPSVGRRKAVAAGLLQATSLPFIVAATQIGVELEKIDEATAAGLVAGGTVSVLLFPALALALLQGEEPA